MSTQGMESDSSSKPVPNHKPTKKKYWVLLIITYFCLFVGAISSSLLSRFYFIHGGSSRWVATWVQSAGCPILLIPIFLPYILNSSNPSNQTQITRPFSLFTPKLLVVTIAIGLMVGFSNFLFSWGTSYLPVSTSSLVLSTQLAFNLILSVLLVKQKLTFLNLNSVILITLGSVVLALGSSHDKPNGVTQAQYFVGFFSILGGALTFALYLPLIELVYKMVSSYEMVMEAQLVTQLTAQAMAAVAMAAAAGFSAMREEAEAKFDLGPRAYWVTLGFTLVAWQMSFMGTAGLVYLTKSLTGGVCMTAILPINVFGGVVVFGDRFGGTKAITTLLCLWGFVSYVYGEYIKSGREKEKKKDCEGVEEMKNMKEKENEVGGGGSDVA